MTTIELVLKLGRVQYNMPDRFPVVCVRDVDIAIFRLDERGIRVLHCSFAVDQHNHLPPAGSIVSGHGQRQAAAVSGALLPPGLVRVPLVVVPRQQAPVPQLHRIQPAVRARQGERVPLGPVVPVLVPDSHDHEFLPRVDYVLAVHRVPVCVAFHPIRGKLRGTSGEHANPIVVVNVEDRLDDVAVEGDWASTSPSTAPVQALIHPTLPNAFAAPGGVQWPDGLRARRCQQPPIG
mmetsp:Transcript_5163/g.8964  ORF Transcript_5163/g.8964 Transcript_5163/m.8964 type:complete len:235 (-) Transcript_5163:1261-1965(-)